MSAPVRAIIFDLDGVLTDTAEHHYRAWKRLADEHGLAFDRDANEALRGVSRGESLRLILGDTAVDDEVFDQMLRTKNDDYVASLDALTPDAVLPGTARVLADARRRGWRLAVGSSSRNARLVLDRLGLAENFDVVIDGTSGVPAKPAPDLFELAARLVDVPSDECVVVEDAASGVAAAVAAGMRVVGIGDPDRLAAADLVVASLEELDLDVVASLGARAP